MAEPCKLKSAEPCKGKCPIRSTKKQKLRVVPHFHLNRNGSNRQLFELGDILSKAHCGFALLRASGQTAVAGAISWMILLISGRQEPQFVPAFVASPTAATVRQPRATTADISLAPVPKQAQTVAPRSIDPAAGRPARTAVRLLGSALACASCEIAQSRETATGSGAKNNMPLRCPLS